MPGDDGCKGVGVALQSCIGRVRSVRRELHSPHCSAVDELKATGRRVEIGTVGDAGHVHGARQTSFRRVERRPGLRARAVQMDGGVAAEGGFCRQTVTLSATKGRSASRHWERFRLSARLSAEPPHRTTALHLLAQPARYTGAAK